MNKMPNKEKFYRGDKFATLKELEDRCATDETDGVPKELISLELGEQNEKAGTVGTFKKPSSNPDLGLLIFEEFDPDDDAATNLLVTEHELDNKPEQFRGKAQIGDDQLDVIVFRGESN